MAGINIPADLPPDLNLQQAVDEIIRLRDENTELRVIIHRIRRRFSELEDLYEDALEHLAHLRQEPEELVDEVFEPPPAHPDAPPSPPPQAPAQPPPPQPPAHPVIPPIHPVIPAAPPVIHPAPVIPPAAPRNRRVPPVHPRINLFPIPRYPHPPQNHSEADMRRLLRQNIKEGKERLDTLFRLVVTQCRGIAVPRALFDRHIKDLVGDASPARLGLNIDLIPAPRSPEEHLLVSRFVVARDIAVANFRRRMLDRDITVAMGTPLAP